MARRSMSCAGAEDRDEHRLQPGGFDRQRARPSPHAAVKKDDQPAPGVRGQRFTKHGRAQPLVASDDGGRRRGRDWP